MRIYIKGYIDAIEARLHQTEALLGILIASQDERAVGLIEDLGNVRHFLPSPRQHEYIDSLSDSHLGSARKTDHRPCQQFILWP